MPWTRWASRFRVWWSARPAHGPAAVGLAECGAPLFDPPRR